MRRGITITLVVVGMVLATAWAACTGMLVWEWCKSGRNLAPLHIRIADNQDAGPLADFQILARTPWGGPDPVAKAGTAHWAVRDPRLRYITEVRIETENEAAAFAIDAVQYAYGEARQNWQTVELLPGEWRKTGEADRMVYTLNLQPLRATVLPMYRGTLNWKGDFNLFIRAAAAVLLMLAVLVMPVIILAVIIQQCVRAVRFDKFSMSRLYASAGLAMVVITAVIMLLNTFTHPPENSYDANRQEAAVRHNQDLYRFAPQTLPYQFEYHPVYYYYVFGKANRFWEIILDCEINPYYLMRTVHVILMSSILLAYAFLFVPKFLSSEAAGLILVGMMAVIPNIYVAQVMVRPGHFLLFTVHLLFIAWFVCDFEKRLGRDWRVTLAWALLLIIMANTQHLAFPAFALFFGWGALVLFRNYRRLPSSNPAKFAKILLLCGVISLSAGHHYLLRYVRTGHITAINRDLPYFKKYYELQKDFDRLPMFVNLEFDKLLKTPNRFAGFEDGNAFLPRLYGDMWGDHWLYFSGPLPHQENKVWIKRVVFVLALPFTLVYFLAPLFSLGRPPVWRWEKYDKIAAFLFLASFLLLILLVYRVPEPGKNSLVKFCYMMGSFWFPAVAAGRLFDKHKLAAKVFVIYLILLWISCIPLYLYIV